MFGILGEFVLCACWFSVCLNEHWGPTAVLLLWRLTEPAFPWQCVYVCVSGRVIAGLTMCLGKRFSSVDIF